MRIKASVAVLGLIALVQTGAAPPGMAGGTAPKSTIILTLKFQCKVTVPIPTGGDVNPAAPCNGVATGSGTARTQDQLDAVTFGGNTGLWTLSKILPGNKSKFNFSLYNETVNENVFTGSGRGHFRATGTCEGKGTCLLHGTFSFDRIGPFATLTIPSAGAPKGGNVTTHIHVDPGLPADPKTHKTDVAHHWCGPVSPQGRGQVDAILKSLPGPATVVWLIGSMTINC